MRIWAGIFLGALPCATATRGMVRTNAATAGAQAGSLRRMRRRTPARLLTPRGNIPQWRCWVFSFLLLADLPGVASARGWGDATEGRPILQVFKASDNQTESQVSAVAQDRDGVLYFASDGLLRYDGSAWQHFQVGRDAVMKYGAADELGRIWVAAFGELGYFEKNASGQLHYTSLLPQLPPEYRDQLEIWAVDVTSHGIVFSANNKIMRWDGRSFTIWPLREARRSDSQKIGNTVYTFHGRTGLWKFEGDVPVLVVPSDISTGPLPSYLKPDGDSFLTVTTWGLARLEGSKLTLLSGNSNQYIKNNFLTSAVALDDATLAVGTYSGGAIIIDLKGDILRVIDRSSGLPNQTVDRLFVDSEKSLWIMTESGIARMDSSGAVTLFDESNHLTGRPIRSIAAQDGRLYVLTGEGIFVLNPRPDVRSSAAFELLSQYDMKLSYAALLPHSKGLLGSGFSGVRLLQPDGAVQAVYHTHLDVWNLLESRHYPGRIYFSDSKSVGWLTEEEGQWRAYPQQVLTPEPPFSLAEDFQGNLWVSLNHKGVLRIVFGEAGAPPKITQFKPGAGLPADAGQIAIGAFHNHVLLLTQAGILGHNPVDDTFSPVAALQDLKQGFALSNPDASGNVWLAANAPLVDGTMRPVVGALTLDQRNQLVWRQLPISGLERAGTPTVLYFQEEAPGRPLLWIGGTEALLRVKLDQLQDQQVSFNTLLSAVSTLSPAGKTALPLFGVQPPRLPYAHNHFEFNFAAATYRDPQYVRYQTQLAGFERDWTEPNAKNFREFTNLNEGAYTFKVRAANADGRWSEPAAYRFFILPPWYRTPWAYSLFSLAAVGLIYGGYRLRVRQMRVQTKQLETLVRHRTDELARANAAKTDFIANMSHEIRNPLNGVIGLASLLQESELNSQQRGIAVSLRKCAEYLSTLVEDVLDFSTIEAGRITIDAQPFNLRSVFADVESIFAWQAQEQQTSISTHMDPELPEMVIGDEAKIKQIVINYVANALKYAGRGAIVIAAEGRPAAGAIVELAIEVRDQGPGIPYDEQARLFEKFNRGRRARQEKIRGTGLGLAVCRAYAEKMGGTVGLTSALGQGSTFWFKVALAISAVQPATAEVAARPAPTTRALIVEDQEYNLLVIENILSRLGYQTDHATDGNEALAKLQTDLYDIVFMDWDLPGLNGVEVTRRFRQWEPPKRHTLIIATTAYCTPEKRRECLEAGMDGFAAKPLSPEKIKATIQNLSGPLRAGSSIPIRAAEEPPRKTLDLSIFRYLSDQQPEKRRQLTEEFITVLDKDVALLAGAVGAGNVEATRRQAHRILSQAALISAVHVAALAATIQEAARNRDIEMPRSALGSFAAEVASLKESLRSAL